MTHPVGEISFFNDAAFAIASDVKALETCAGLLGCTALPKPVAGVTRLADSGYIRVEQKPAVALLDVAPVGPDYLPGHAHADTLSFELSLFGQRLVVNSGISCYGAGPERLRQRGTASHSTVEIDGMDSSEVWSGFRVARRARPVGLEVCEADGVVKVSCGHDGYQRLSGRPIHWRQWLFNRQSLSVRDSINGSFHTATARYHFHPSVEVTGHAGAGTLILPDGHKVRWQVYKGEARVVPSTWHPEFGQSLHSQYIEIQCIKIQPGRGQANIEFFWD